MFFAAVLQQFLLRQNRLNLLILLVKGYGGGGNRTPDLRIANATLSHLSYTPETGRVHSYSTTSSSSTVWLRKRPGQAALSGQTIRPR